MRRGEEGCKRREGGDVKRAEEAWGFSGELRGCQGQWAGVLFRVLGSFRFPWVSRGFVFVFVVLSLRVFVCVCVCARALAFFLGAFYK